MREEKHGRKKAVEGEGARNGGRREDKGVRNWKERKSGEQGKKNKE
jgi:hypothetical protein